MDAQRDALIMDHLQDKDDVIIRPYGSCGASVMTEAIPYEVEEYVVPGTGYHSRSDPNELVKPHNSYTSIEKLQMALEMAESLAKLHGFKGGAIVHADVQLSQWLRTRSGRLKLGDFNVARILDWNEREQKYCTFSTGTVFGNVSDGGGRRGGIWSLGRFPDICFVCLYQKFRSPEEFEAGSLDEKIDVYSFGNCMYGLVRHPPFFVGGISDSYHRLLIGCFPLTFL